MQKHMFNSDYDRMWSPTKEGQRKSKPKVDIHEERAVGITIKLWMTFIHAYRDRRSRKEQMSRNIESREHSWG